MQNVCKSKVSIYFHFAAKHIAREMAHVIQRDAKGSNVNGEHLTRDVEKTKWLHPNLNQLLKLSKDVKREVLVEGAFPQLSVLWGKIEASCLYPFLFFTPLNLYFNNHKF